jgi:hypothetical protein
MKKNIYCIILISLLFITSAIAQGNKSDVLQNLEKNQTGNQNITATLKSSSRLFGTKDDLTSVILIIPSGSTVKVSGSDSTYLHVTYEENEGYIFSKHAVIDKNPVNIVQPAQNQQSSNQQPVKEQQGSRFSYLEGKYGTTMAARLNAGKVWKGMNSEMVKDSWGTAEKVTREIDGNIIKEEWIYKTTWLYFENNTLKEWGPARRE